MDIPGTSESVTVRGVLGWNEFEGGFWSLDLDEPHPLCGARVVLASYTPGPGMKDGTNVEAQVVPHPERMSFQMSGTMVDVLELVPLA